MGLNQRFDYSGDAVNLAARLEGQSKEYGLTLLVGETSVTDDYKFLELDRIAVKGKTEPATIYTALFNKIGNTFINEHNKFLEFYRNANWTQALQQIERLQKMCPVEIKKYYDVMRSRSQDMQTRGIEQWDGIYVATTK